MAGCRQRCPARPRCYSVDGGVRWAEVHGFPAGVSCPPGVDEEDWDDDGDREGRHVCPLADGRLLVTWCLAPSGRPEPSRGIHYNISLDAGGAEWDASRTVVLLPDVECVGRWYSPRTVQIDDKWLGTCFVRGPQATMEGVFFVKVPLRSLDSV